MSKKKKKCAQGIERANCVTEQAAPIHFAIVSCSTIQQWPHQLCSCEKAHIYNFFLAWNSVCIHNGREWEGRYFSKSRHLTPFGYHSKLFAFIKGIEDTYISLHRNSLSDFSHKHLLAKSPVIWYDIKRSRERAWHKKTRSNLHRQSTHAGY